MTNRHRFPTLWTKVRQAPNCTWSTSWREVRGFHLADLQLISIIIPSFPIGNPNAKSSIIWEIIGKREVCPQMLPQCKLQSSFTIIRESRRNQKCWDIASLLNDTKNSIVSYFRDMRAKMLASKTWTRNRTPLTSMIRRICKFHKSVWPQWLEILILALGLQGFFLP